jgi:hypothetical protein
MMIAEEYLTRSRLFRRLRNGPHASYVELYVSRLVKIGLNPRSTWRSPSQPSWRSPELAYAHRLNTD